MAAIQIKELPPSAAERIARLARERGVQVEEAAWMCLERGISELEQVQSELNEIRKLRDSLGSVHLTEEMIRAARDEGRP
jgi:hypothetical protein